MQTGRLTDMLDLPFQWAQTDMQVTDFKHGNVWPVMIVSYETLRKFADSLAGYCDVLVCDEGHRYFIPSS